MNLRSFILRSSVPALGAILLFVLGGIIYSQERPEKAAKAEKAPRNADAKVAAPAPTRVAGLE